MRGTCRDPGGRRLALAGVILLCLGVSGVAPLAADPQALSGAIVLTFDEICRRAKEHGVVARLLESERRFIGDASVPWASPVACRLAGDLLEQRRATAGNEASRAAALAYCRVRSCDSRLAICAEREARLDEVLARLDAIEKAGGVTGVDRQVVQKQATAARIERLALAAERAVQWLTLAGSVGEPGEGSCGDGPRIPETIDHAEETDKALRARTDLRAAETMRSRLSRQTLPVARTFVSQADPALGQKPPPTLPVGRGWHASPFDTVPRELTLRCRQLELLCDEKREEVRTQVSIAASALKAAKERALYTISAVNASVRRAELLAASPSGPGATAVRIALAELEVLEARLLHLEAEARVEVATVELQAACQGL